MGQIVKRKKKGRPSKADLARRASAEVEDSPATESDIRRSRRRRNVKYNIEYDDYLDEDDEDEDEDERRKEKKLKLVLKLPSDRGGSESDSARNRKGARDVDAHQSEEEEYGNRRTNKKKRMDGGDENDEDEDEDEDNDVDEEKVGKVESKGHDSAPGTPPSDHQSRVPLPDKKTLELILDKLQKKDIYGVYAEPVDPEELPDYHDVIEHPMDFATVRKKLSNGSYSTLEQFESDIDLICSNAMQYNAADTIYYKQARTIQELAQRKFLKVRIDFDRSEKELKPAQKIISNSLPKKQMRKSVGRTSQEPVGSDFSSGATLATVGDVQNSQNVTQAGGGDKPSNIDGHVEGNSSLVENNLEKAELLSGKGLLSKFGRKLTMLDENRRTTYDISNQPVVKSDSTYTIFEGEHKQLVAVGLQAEYSYGRSLARFAATLGPFAWKVASKRIEQALPVGFKFGRGWVGEYEPLPTPVLMLENRSQKEPAFFKKLQRTTSLRMEDRNSNTSAPIKERSVIAPTLEGNPSSCGSAVERKPSLIGCNGTRPSTPVNTINQQQNPFSRNHAAPGNKVGKHVELNFPPIATQNKTIVAKKELSNSPKMAASRSAEVVSRDMNLLQTVPSKQQNNNGAVSVRPNGRVITNSMDNNRLGSSSPDSVPNQMTKAGTYFPHGQEQSLNDPAQMMRMLAEKGQKQQKSLNNLSVDSSPVMPSVSSSRRDDSNNAAAAAARAWMSIGAGGFKPVAENSSLQRSQISADSLYNPARDLHPQVLKFRGDIPVGGMHVSPEHTNFPVQAFVPQPVRMSTESQFHNRPIVPFPHLVTADLSRFQVQTPWRGLSPQTHQPRQKQDTLPPDLNISFQSSGSPVSGVFVDSQQPDLALQL